MATIYDQHRAAFPHVSAYVIAKDGDRVATIAFKFPRDGAGRLYAYVHWIGTEMVRGFAAGGGYDKRSAACSAAMSVVHKRKHSLMFAEPGSAMECFVMALLKDDGLEWHNRLRDAGFTVWQAV